MVVTRVKTEKLEANTEYEVGKNGVKHIGFRGDWTVVYFKNKTITFNPLLGIKKIVEHDGKEIPQEFKRQKQATNALSN
jgi:hypothetical protein